MLKKSFQATEDQQIYLAHGTAQENAIVNNAIKNIAICKNVYNHLYSTLADCLRQAFNFIKKDQLKKIVKYLRQKYFFNDFDYKHTAQYLLRAHAHFFNELGRFPESLEFAIVPHSKFGDIPNSITLLILHCLVICITDLDYQMQEN